MKNWFLRNLFYFDCTTGKVEAPVFEPVIDKEVNEQLPSFVKFNIADDLSVSLETNINDATLQSMIKSEYLNEVESEQEEVIHLAAVVLSGDIITGIIEEVNGE